MSEFQLDECFSDPAFAAACELLAKDIYSVEVRAHLFPRSLKGKDDDDVLDAVMPNRSPLITKDRRMVYDHTLHIPERNPGIIVVACAPGRNRTMTIPLAGMILTEFKKICSDWHSLTIANSILEINQDGVLVQHVSESRVVTDGYVAFGDDDWKSRFVELLSTNSSRG